MPPTPPPEVFQYTIDRGLAPFDMTPRAWMWHNDRHWDGIAVATAVFNGEGRVLLVQRAAHDSMPNRWEMPGGAADQEDDGDDRPGPGSGDAVSAAPDAASKRPGSILRAAARELWEEAGLVATHFARLVPLRGVPGAAADHPGHVFTNRTGSKTFCQFAFHVLVQQTYRVTLDPNEHQDYVWAAEDEVREQRQRHGAQAGRPLPITGRNTQALILEAFRQQRAGVGVVR